MLDYLQQLLHLILAQPLLAILYALRQATGGHKTLPCEDYISFTAVWVQGEDTATLHARRNGQCTRYIWCSG